MRQLLATLRRRPGPLIGTLVALTTASAMVTATASMIGTGSKVHAPADRLAAASVVVAGGTDLHVTVGHGDNADHENLALPSYRRLPTSLTSRIAAVPGVAHVAADVSVPVSLALPGGRFDAGSAAVPLTGHGWSSAALTPLRLTAGHPPAGPRDIVVGAAVARADGLRPGSVVRLAGRQAPPFTVTGVATPAGGPARHLVAERGSVFFTEAEAARLYGHPGQADLLAVSADRGVPAAALASRIRHVMPAADTVASGAARGRLEDLSAAADASQLQELATGVGIDIALIALFVVAGAVALSVGLRRRQFALLRAVGSTSGQVRRGVMAELATLGVLGGVLGFLPGGWLAAWGVRAMIGHDLLARGTQAWLSPWILLIAAGTGVIAAELSGVIAARRAGRVSPAGALRESATERWWPHPVRIVLGLAALGGGIALMDITLNANGGNQLNQAFPLLLLLMAAIALLGPLLVALAEIVLRWPARLFSRVSGRLALADVAARPRRMASAVIPVALAVAMIGAIYFVDASITHASVTEGAQRLTAGQVVTAPGPGFSPAALAAVRTHPGVRDAVGLTAANVTVTDPDLDPASAEAVSPGSLSGLLDLGVTAGSLAHFGPGDIAVSRIEVGSAGMNAHLGQQITVYLPDGTPYRGRLTAEYARSFGFGDVMLPAAAVAGHNGGTGYGQILVRGAAGTSPARLAAGLGLLAGQFPGLTVASRKLTNAQADLSDAQDNFVNNMVLAVIALLAAIALINTLVVATVERRESLLLLRRVGATTRQLMAVTGWQSVLLGLTGVLLGAAAAAATLCSVCRALTGSWTPYVTAAPAAGIVAAVLGLTLAATLGPAAVILRPGQERA